MGKKKSSSIVGYRYSLGCALGICESADELVSFMMSDEIVATPNLKASGTFMAKTGENAKTYGSSGNKSTITWYNGTQTTANSYLTQKTGYELIYKNLSYALINGFIGDNVSSLPSYHFIVKKTSYDIAGFTEYRDINGDINPAYAIWHMLVVLNKVNAELLDINSFKNVAKALYDEGLGVSFTMGQANECKEWIEEILKCIDGVLYVDPKNGLIGLKLLRNNYDIKNLQYVNESNISDLKFTRKSWDDTYSSVTIKFTNRNGFKEDTLTASNPATQRTIGYEKNTSLEYKAISNQKAAQKILDRCMRKYTYPYASLKFNVSLEDFPYIGIGDVLVFSNSDLGVSNMPIRVMNLGGDSGEQKISIEAVEDIFALDIISFAKPGKNLDQGIDTSIGELKYFGAVEATPEMGETLGVLPFAIAPSGFCQRLAVRDGASGEMIDIPEWYVGELLGDLDITDEVTSESFIIKEISPLWALSSTRAAWQRHKMACVIDDEFITFGYRKDLGDGKWEVSELIRGMSGTAITKHQKGAKVWFAPLDANDLPTLSLISPNTTLYFFASNYKSESEPKTLNFSHSRKSEKAYPVSNVWGERNGDEVILHWRNRVRLAGANYRNIDNLTAGADEGLAEGVVFVSYNDKRIEVARGKESVTIKGVAENTKFSIRANATTGEADMSEAVILTI